ncbi:MAG: glycosyltransferase family 9 protein [Chitinivibrionales bacterium]|nr:glycosyltransferase family 9 protein [Chitinivibrionales bacterium]
MRFSLHHESAVLKVPNRIITVFLTPGGLGEVIMQTPFYAVLKKWFPHCSITALVHHNLKAVLQNNPHLEMVHTYTSLNSLMKFFYHQHRQRYDYCFIFDKTWKSIYMTRWGIGARHYCGFRRRSWEGFVLDQAAEYTGLRQETDCLLELAQAVFAVSEAIPKEIATPRMYPLDSDRAAVDQLLPEDALLKDKDNRLICLCAGGAQNPGIGDEPFRRWPVENYCELAGMLLHQRYQLLLVGGKNDKNINNAIKKSCVGKPGTVHDLTGLCSFVQSGIAMSRVKLVVTNDSGLMHLGACFNENILALFGPTSPQTVLPRVQNAHYIWYDQDIYSPDTRKFGTKSLRKHRLHRYFLQVTPEVVFEKITAILDDR